MEATKEKKDLISNCSRQNLCRHNLDFYISNTVVVVDLFVVVVAAAAVVVSVVVAVGKDKQE